MDMIDRYLNAVAAQLPQDERADITAELRDLILSRFEAKEEELGRALSEDGQEAILREIGHPLAVAARYGSGPQHVVGPELYPWWMFGVRIGLIAIAAITVLGVIVRVLVGDVEAGQAIGQAIHSTFNGAITLIGFATVAAFIIERQKEKPRFIREWRVKDLGLFEFGGGLNAEVVTRGLSGGDWSTRTMAVSGRGSSPVARAAASAVGWSVVLLWWVGWLPLTHTTPESLGAVIGGVDYSRMLREMHALLYWPVIAFGLLRIVFDLMRAARPNAVRFTALGDIGFGAAEAVMFGWVWMYSPMSEVVFVPTVEAFLDRLRATVETGWPLTTVLMLCVVAGFAQAAVKVIGGLIRLLTGVDRRLAKA